MTGIRQLFARYGANRRFWKHARVGGPGECWPWSGPRDRDGAPWFDGGPAQQKAYELARGPVPPGASVRRTCGEPACVNPDHLEPHRGGE